MNLPPASTQRAISTKTTSHSEAETRFARNRRVLARIAWFALVAFALAVFATGLPQYFTSLHEVCHSSLHACSSGQLLLQSAQLLQNVGISVGVYAMFALVLTVAITMVWFIVGTVIFWRK